MTSTIREALEAMSPSEQFLIGLIGTIVCGVLLRMAAYRGYGRGPKI